MHAIIETVFKIKVKKNVQIKSIPDGVMGTTNLVEMCEIDINNLKVIKS